MLSRLWVGRLKNSIGALLISLCTISTLFLIAKPNDSQSFLKLQGIECTAGIDKDTLASGFRRRLAETIFFPKSSIPIASTYGAPEEVALLLISDSTRNSWRTCRITYGTRAIDVPFIELTQQENSAHIEFYTKRAGDARLSVRYIPQTASEEGPIHTLKTMREESSRRGLSPSVRGATFLLPPPSDLLNGRLEVKLSNLGTLPHNFTLQQYARRIRETSIAVVPEVMGSINIRPGLLAIIPGDAQLQYSASAHASLVDARDQSLSITPSKLLRGISHVITGFSPKNQHFLQIANVNSSPQTVGIKAMGANGEPIAIPDKACSLPSHTGQFSLNPYEVLICSLDTPKATQPIARFEITGQRYLAQAIRLNQKGELTILKAQENGYFSRTNRHAHFVTENNLSGANYELIVANPIDRALEVDLRYQQAEGATLRTVSFNPLTTQRVSIPNQTGSITINSRDVIYQMIENDTALVEPVFASIPATDEPRPGSGERTRRQTLEIIRPGAQIVIGQTKQTFLPITIQCRLTNRVGTPLAFRFRILRTQTQRREPPLVLSGVLDMNCFGAVNIPRAIVSQESPLQIRIDAFSPSNPNNIVLSASRDFAFLQNQGSPSGTASPSATNTTQPTSTPTEQPTETATVSPTPTNTATHTIAATNTPTPTATAESTSTATPSPTATSTATDTPLSDECPHDPQKLTPGICGCGTPDTDSDGDKTPDCHDTCPTHAQKVDPGVCGCDTTDGDTDGDGTPDCIDSCPQDPNKPLSGVCGCGVSDVDSDTDGTADCIDECPKDRLKQKPGSCGCGIPDTDSDKDDTPDCQDQCPKDPHKTKLGDCGCGKSEDECRIDSDGDGTADTAPSEQLDTDADGILNKFESSVIDTDKDGTDNERDADDDNDGITTRQECPRGFPCPDGDSDGVPNYIERNDRDTDGDGLYDWKDDDDDGDGQKTRSEIGTTDSIFVFRDSDRGGNGDGVPDFLDPGEEDSDNDTVGDSSEFLLPCSAENAGKCGVSKDSDSDSIPDHTDQCDTDPKKFEAGTCGCGIEDVDSDRDGTPDCKDSCKADAKKQDPGSCGCGVSDIDSDKDGTPDCKDQCPSNSTKTTPGVCGCNASEEDGDKDGAPNCTDKCPSDPNKQAPGICGCSVPDVDTDGDNTLDCRDGCPQDRTKTSAGLCGCGVSDIDSDQDGRVDCLDRCPQDRLKTEPGTCGCGIRDTDTDGDRVADCNDTCPNDKSKTVPGICGCGVPDSDSDNDGAADCVDQCPANPNKKVAGICGCETSDEECQKQDLCPEDPTKQVPGICGCGVPDTDENKNSLIDCEESSKEARENSSNTSAFDDERVALLNIKATRVVNESLSSTAAGMTSFLESIGIKDSSIFEQDAAKTIIPRGSKVSAFVDYGELAKENCTVEPFFRTLITTQVREEATKRARTPMPYGVSSFTTESDITAGALETLIKEQKCKVISGISDEIEKTSGGLVVSGTFNNPDLGMILVRPAG